MTPEVKLVSPRQAGEILGCGQTKIAQLRRDGTLESLKIGRSRKITLASINAFIERQRAGLPPAKPDYRLAALEKARAAKAARRLA